MNNIYHNPINLKKFHSSEEIKSIRIDEAGIVLGETIYKNVRIVEFDEAYYVVSKKAILTLCLTSLCNADCKFCYNGISFFPTGDIDPNSSTFQKILTFAEAGEPLSKTTMTVPDEVLGIARRA